MAREARRAPSWAPEWLKALVFRRLSPDRLTWDELTAEMDKALQFPGVSNAWTMPIKARIDMLSTGIRTPIGIKVFGTSLDQMDKVARDIEQVVKAVRACTVANDKQRTATGGVR